MNIRAEAGKYSNMYFILRIEGTDLACKSFHNFEQEVEYETISEGGLNDRVHIRPKPASKPFSFQVERYIGPGFEDPLPVGKTLQNDAVLMVSSQAGQFQEPEGQFFFSGCIVTGKSYGGADAEKSGLLTETTTVAYESVLAKWKDAQI